MYGKHSNRNSKIQKRKKKFEKEKITMFTVLIN